MGCSVFRRLLCVYYKIFWKSLEVRNCLKGLVLMVPGAGIEPARPLSRKILSLVCLPISPPGLGWRRGSESNRRRLSCSQLHSHFATAPFNLNYLGTTSNWSGKRGSNSRPQPWQGCALPLSYSRFSITHLKSGNCCSFQGSAILAICFAESRRFGKRL